jgi:hypothetical protein
MSDKIPAVKTKQVKACQTHTLVEPKKDSQPISLKKLSDKNKYHGSLSNLIIH